MKITIDIPDHGTPQYALRALADALLAALEAPAPQPPAPQPPAPPAPQPPAPPPSGKLNWHDEILRGDYGRKLFVAEHGVVDVFPFVVNGPPYAPRGPLIQTSVSENQGHPWLRIVAISRTPGDVTYSNALAWVRGKETMATILAGVDAAVGERLYINTLIDEQGDPDLSTASGMSIVWSQAVE
jgi:hypothetical protein